jgi:hypothetical protein
MRTKDIAEYRRLLAERRRDVLKTRKECDKALARIDGELRALESNKTTPLSTDPALATGAILKGATIALEKLNGMSQPEAAVAIAKTQGGVIKTKDLIHILQRAGLMKATNNAGNIAYRLLVNSGRFERIATGCYRLKRSVTRVNEEDPSNSQEHFIAAKQIQ